MMIIEISDHIFCRNIRYLRKKYSVSRIALAKLVGISVYTLKNWETESVIPRITPYVLQRICDIFRESATTLIHTDLEAYHSSQ